MAMTADQNSRGRYGIGQRFTRLLVRRPALFHFVVAIVVARIAFSVLDLVESRIVGYSLLITLALAIEVVVIWRRIGPHRGRVHQPRVGAEGSSLERFLTLTERFGAATVCAVTAAALVVELVLAVRGESRTTLLDVTGAVRWVELAILLVVLLVARTWDRRFPEVVSPSPTAPSTYGPGSGTPPPAQALPPSELSGGNDPTNG
jgi:hypothetical protein